MKPGAVPYQGPEEGVVTRAEMPDFLSHLGKRSREGGDSAGIYSHSADAQLDSAKAHPNTQPGYLPT